jgi:hypothetical protein
VRNADKHAAICEPIVWKMWKPRRHITLWDFTACYRDSFSTSEPGNAICCVGKFVEEISCPSISEFPIGVWIHTESANFLMMAQLFASLTDDYIFSFPQQTGIYKPHVSYSHYISGVDQISWEWSASNSQWSSEVACGQSVMKHFIASNDGLIEKWSIGNDLGGISRGLIEILSLHWPDDAEENHVRP